jgi:hypothetical protein
MDYYNTCATPAGGRLVSDASQGIKAELILLIQAVVHASAFKYSWRNLCANDVHDCARGMHHASTPTGRMQPCLSII